jgi:hypothetical protein
MIVLFLYFLYYLHNTYKKENYQSQLKILNLVLYSDSPEYNEMYNITNDHYKKYKNVKTVYYRFSNNYDKEIYNYDENKNMLYIKGKDTYLPGVLDKTLKAFYYFKDNYRKYDYIVRTNISSIVNFNNLCDDLEKHPLDYGTSIPLMIRKNYRDLNCGINNDRYQGTEYASGTCIILSRRLFGDILSKLNLFDYSVIDDVSIGYFVKNNTKYTLEKLDKYILTDSNFFRDEKIHKYILFRNKSDNRNKDLEMMKYIVKNI